MYKVEGGIFNPLNSKKACFKYEVEETGEVKNVEYPDGYGGTDIQPERPVLLKLAGSFMAGEKIYCTICGKDALKPLREGELISAGLRFGVTKDDDGNYVQHITVDNVFTINDYIQIREAEARYEGEIHGSKEKCQGPVP